MIPTICPLLQMLFLLQKVRMNADSDKLIRNCPHITFDFTYVNHNTIITEDKCIIAPFLLVCMEAFSLHKCLNNREHSITHYPQVPCVLLETVKTNKREFNL